MKELWEGPIGDRLRKWRELKGIGIKDWKWLVLERNKWKKIVEQAKP
jgi:hypothetical protein